MFDRLKRSVSAGVAAKLRCSFCNKDEDEVKKLIAGPAVFICDECVDACNAILVDDARAGAADAARREAVARAAARAVDPTITATHCALCGREYCDEEAEVLLVNEHGTLCARCVDDVHSALTER